jgi:hypothetical protein
MSAKSDKDREDLAFDALIVSQLRREGECGDDDEHLPELTESDCKAMNALGADLVERLLNGQAGPAFDCESELGSESSESEELVGAGDGIGFGFNRASCVDHDLLDEKRRKLIERLQSTEDRDEKRDGQSRP